MTTGRPRAVAGGLAAGVLLHGALAPLSLAGGPRTAAAAAPPDAGRTCCFDDRGSDETGDGTAEHPWASLARAGGLALRPGDKVLLAGGRTFRGTLHLGPGSAGKADAPVTIGSWGEGRATIDAGEGDGVLVENAGGVRVENLVVRGAGPRANRRSGVKFLNTLPGSTRLDFVRIDHVQASGFGREGIVVIGWPADRSQSGYRDVRITDCSARDNGYCGIYVSGFFDEKASGYADADVYVGRCAAWGNRGDPDFRDNHSGSGIFIEDADGALVEDCTAHDNGDLCPCPHAGPCGIWAAGANRVTIQHCESWSNRCATPVDGDGFDFDGGCIRCLMQYNYSHDNQGAGFLVYTYPHAPHRFADVVLRYNVSENDARRGDYAAVHVVNDGAGVKDVTVYNNTVFVGPRERGEVPQALRVQRTTGARFFNNVFLAGGRADGGRPDGRGALVFLGPDQPGLLLRGNCYWNAAGPVRVHDGGEVYEGLAAWRRATGRERDGAADTGMEVDPGLTAPGRGGTLDGRGRPEGLSAYRLRADSPLHGAGVAVDSGADVPPAEQDFFGEPPGTGRQSIGASR